MQRAQGHGFQHQHIERSLQQTGIGTSSDRNHIRGFLMRYLHSGPTHLPLVLAVVISSLVFGMNHLYQGWGGTVRTSISGLAFGTLFLVAGSLFLPMVLHAAIDLQTLLVLRRGAAPAPQPRVG